MKEPEEQEPELNLEMSDLMKAIQHRIREAKKKQLLDQLPESPQTLTIPGIEDGDLGHPWKGIDPSIQGRHWLVPPGDLDQLDRRGGIQWIDQSPYMGIPGLVFDPQDPSEIEQARVIIRDWLQRRLTLWDEDFVGWIFEKVVDIPDGPARYRALCRLAYEAAGEEVPDQPALPANAELAGRVYLERAFQVIERHCDPSVNIRELYAQGMTLLCCLVGERFHGALLCCERKALFNDLDLANLVGDGEAIKRLVREILAVNEEVTESCDRQQRLWDQCPEEDLVSFYDEVEGVAEAAQIIHARGRPDLTKVRRRKML